MFVLTDLIQQQGEKTIIDKEVFSVTPNKLTQDFMVTVKHID